MRNGRLVVLRATSLEVLKAGLKALGFEVRDDVERPEDLIERCCTPVMETLTGNVVTVLVSPSQFDRLPEVTSPEFLVDWRPDALDVDGLHLEWPEYRIQDDEGERLQGAGRIG